MTALWVLGAWLAAASAATLVAPPVHGAIPLHPLAALLAGGAVGIALFVALARRRTSVRGVPTRRALARTTVLVVRSAYEECLWRGLVLALLLPLGRAAALAVSSTLFAAAHAPRLGRLAAIHVGTGAAFGALYLATGTLVAPVAAHGAYNAMLGLALLARDRPLWPMDERERGS